MAKGIQKYSKNKCHVVDSTEFESIKKLSGWHKNYSGVCQFSWTEATYGLPIRNCVVVAHEGLKYAWPQSGAGYGPQLSTKIRNRDRAAQSLPHADVVIAFNTDLKHTAGKHNKKTVVLYPAVDHEIYKFSNWPDDGKFRIGWCGQSGSVSKCVPLRDAVAQKLRERGVDAEWCINDRTHEDPLQPQEMQKFYSQCNMFLCTSCSEGGPLPVFEALSCGIPVFSTSVGVVSDFTVERCLRKFTAPRDHLDVDRIAANIADEIYRSRIWEWSDTERLRVAIEARKIPFRWSVKANHWTKIISGDWDV